MKWKYQCFEYDIAPDMQHNILQPIVHSTGLGKTEEELKVRMLWNIPPELRSPLILSPEKCTSNSMNIWDGSGSLNGTYLVSCTPLFYENVIWESFT